MAVDIDRDRADGAVLDLIVEPARGSQLVQLPASFGDFEPFVVDLLESVVASEVVGSVTAEEDVRPAFEQLAREADRRPRGAQPRDRARPPRASVHDRGIELDAAARGQHAAAAGVEAHIFFQRPHRRLDRVERAFALLEDRRACGERCLEPGTGASFLLWVELPGLHRPSAAMHYQPPASFAHCGAP